MMKYNIIGIDNSLKKLRAENDKEYVLDDNDDTVSIDNVIIVCDDIRVNDSIDDNGIDDVIIINC